MVRDLEISTRFYTEVMGLKVSDRIDQMVFLRAGEDHTISPCRACQPTRPTATTCPAIPGPGWSTSRTWSRWTR